MPLTMSPGRLEEIRRRVHERAVIKRAAKIGAANDWARQPAFTSVDEFLAYLERHATSQDRPRRPRRGQLPRCRG